MEMSSRRKYHLFVSTLVPVPASGKVRIVSRIIFLSTDPALIDDEVALSGKASTKAHCERPEYNDGCRHGAKALRGSRRSPQEGASK
jgi:hypothetical protein